MSQNGPNRSKVPKGVPSWTQWIQVLASLVSLVSTIVLLIGDFVGFWSYHLLLVTVAVIFIAGGLVIVLCIYVLTKRTRAKHQQLKEARQQLAESDITRVTLSNVNRIEVRKVLRGFKTLVNGVAFSSDGRLLASGSTDGSVRLWRMPDGTPVKELKDHTGWVRSVAFSPNGQLLASGSGDATVRPWHVPYVVKAHCLQSENAEACYY